MTCRFTQAFNCSYFRNILVTSSKHPLANRHLGCIQAYKFCHKHYTLPISSRVYFSTAIRSGYHAPREPENGIKYALHADERYQSERDNIRKQFEQKEVMKSNRSDFNQTTSKTNLIDLADFRRINV